VGAFKGSPQQPSSPTIVGRSNEEVVVGRRGNVLSDHELAEITRLAGQGTSGKKVAEVLGRDPKVVRAVLAGTYKRARAVVGEAGKTEMVALAAAGLVPAEIAARTGWHAATVRRVLGPRPSESRLSTDERRRAQAGLARLGLVGGRRGQVLSAGQRAMVKKLAGDGLGVHDIAAVLARTSEPIKAVLRGDYNPTRPLSEAEVAAITAGAAEGLSPADIAERLGRHPGTVSKVLSRGHGRQAYAWCPSPARLSLAEREQVMVGLSHGASLRAIAAGIGRSPSTVSREVAANGGRAAYAAWSAHGRAAAEARRPKVAKLATCPQLAAQVAEWLEELWSPQQISNRLRKELGQGPMMSVSHETIYKSLYVQGRGALRKELAACLRSGRAARRPQGRLERRGRNPAMVMISERPAEVEDRAVPGHWEGDLLMGASGRSAVGTLVERTCRYLLLLHLTDARAETVDQAMRTAIATLPAEMFRTITWDQGHEMARHARFSIDTGVQVYFCDPHSPWQRGSNENTNGLLRQYMPKGTDLSVYSQDDLARIARSLNNRPRQTLNWSKPSEKLAELLPTVAVTG
jgi:IS30 family transposase